MPALRLALALFVLVSGSTAAMAQSASAQSAPDPQALVGEWAGMATLTAARRGAMRSPYLLTIEKVEGGKVYGRADMREDGSPSSFVGTFRGNTLTFYTGRFETNLILEGKRLYGLRRAGADIENFEIGLDKIEKK